MFDASARRSNDRYHAIVDCACIAGTPAAIATYSTVQQALDDAPADSPTPWRIAVRKGRYREKLTITKPNICLIGEGCETVLTYDAYSGLVRSGNDTWGTAGSASLTVEAPDFAAYNIRIENGFDYPANDIKDAGDPGRTEAPQAVALMMGAGADRAFFDNVELVGHQDTLFVDAGRSYFTNCRISGNVDFIFGAGQAVFEACDVVTRPRARAGVYPIGYVTAPSTHVDMPYGLVFLRCRLVKEDDRVPAGSTPLGRPWHPTRAMPDGRYADPDAVGSAVFIECFMDDHIAPDGWAAMAGTPRCGLDRIWFQPEDARFFEYRNTGPGAHTGSKRRQLSASQAADFTPEKLLGDWTPLPRTI